MAPRRAICEPSRREPGVPGRAVCARAGDGVVLVALLMLAACPRADAATSPEGIQKIQHVVIIMQENRSFDSYFGTYPGRQRHPRGDMRDGTRQGVA